MRINLYNFLVNKQPGIKYRYHKMHDGSTGITKYISWFYLLWLNIAFYCLFMRFVGKLPVAQTYETKILPIEDSESAINHRELSKKTPINVDCYIDILKDYDVISFDIFDTLIFRPFSTPIDLFRVVGEKLEILDFTNIRAWAEWDARVKCNSKNGHMEIKLKDIYDNLEDDLGVSSEWGQRVEIDTELSLCYANPFMKEVWDSLIKMGKRIIVVSDMYLSTDVLSKMLEKNGYSGYEKLYVSCEYGKSKADGSLFKLVKKEIGQKSIIHIGDNTRSDKEMAIANGIKSLLYPRIDRNSILYRPYDMSFIVGSAYRGVVTNHIYNGLKQYSMEYEYGYIYGGLFVVGYCTFIHEYCKKNNIDTLLFLARDGDILKRVYELLFPSEANKTEYAYWSRKAATTLMSNEDKHDYFRRFIYHKVNQDYTIKEILASMNLQSLIAELEDWYSIWLDRTIQEEQQAKMVAIKLLDENEKIIKNSNKWRKIVNKIEQDFSEENLQKIRKKNFIELKGNTKLTDENGYLLRRFIEAKWDKVLSVYETNQIAAKKYYASILKDSKKAVAIDIGWAGSGAMALSHLTKHVWNIPCGITGIIAGTNTPHNSEPDASEPFLQSGKLVAYLYSQSHNRDLLKKHDPNKDYNVYWELLLSSPTPQFTGFYDGKDFSGNYTYLDDLDITLKFGKYDANQNGIKEVQRGILDFAAEYKQRFKDFPYMFNISGRDAYAPMLLASSHNERYLKAIKKKFDLKINIE